MTSHFNLPTFDLYGFQNQLTQQPKFQQQQQQQQQQRYQQVEVVEAIASNTFADTTHFLTSTPQQHAAATAAAQLAYVQQQIPSSYIYSTTSYPSPPLDSSVTFPSASMDAPTDSVDHHHNDSKTYHGIITSPPPFTNDLRDHKPHINTTDNYPTTSSYVLNLLNLTF